MRYLRQEILLWHTRNRRNFPWRHTKDPYRIMIAEFMLHRTRAEQVLPVYLEFIKKYNHVESLAKAKLPDIKKFTARLGLHWRAKHFITAAKYIVQNFNGKFPETKEELLKIPGIGDYVAGAILTICFRKKVSVVDSNIARFINRFYGLNLSGEIRRKKQVIEISAKLFDTAEPGKFLFAIIDFTTAVCKPINPDHKNCPLKKRCSVYKQQEGI